MKGRGSNTAKPWHKEPHYNKILIETNVSQSRFSILHVKNLIITKFPLKRNIFAVPARSLWRGFAVVGKSWRRIFHSIQLAEPFLWLCVFPFHQEQIFVVHVFLLILLFAHFYITSSDYCNQWILYLQDQESLTPNHFSLNCELFSILH